MSGFKNTPTYKYCGTSWSDANTRCHYQCGGGTDEECAQFTGEHCYNLLPRSNCPPNDPPTPAPTPAPTPPPAPTPLTPGSCATGSNGCYSVQYSSSGHCSCSQTSSGSFSKQGCESMCSPAKCIGSITAAGCADKILKEDCNESYTKFDNKQGTQCTWSDEICQQYYAECNRPASTCCPAPGTKATQAYCTESECKDTTNCTITDSPTCPSTPPPSNTGLFTCNDGKCNSNTSSGTYWGNSCDIYCK